MVKSREDIGQVYNKEVSQKEQREHEFKYEEFLENTILALTKELRDIRRGITPVQHIVLTTFPVEPGVDEPLSMHEYEKKHGHGY